MLDKIPYVTKIAPVAFEPSLTKAMGMFRNFATEKGIRFARRLVAAHDPQRLQGPERTWLKMTPDQRRAILIRVVAAAKEYKPGWFRVAALPPGPDNCFPGYLSGEGDLLCLPEVRDRIAVRLLEAGVAENVEDLLWTSASGLTMIEGLQFTFEADPSDVCEMIEALRAAEEALAEGHQNCGGGDDNIYAEPLRKVREVLANA